MLLSDWTIRSSHNVPNCPIWIGIQVIVLLSSVFPIPFLDLIERYPIFFFLGRCKTFLIFCIEVIEHPIVKDDRGIAVDFEWQSTSLQRHLKKNVDCL